MYVKPVRANGCLHFPLYRMEKLDVKSLRSQIKITGALLSISGAIITILYKGPSIASLLSQHQQLQSSFSTLKTTNNWVIGGFLLAIASLSFAILNISQVNAIFINN